MPSKLIYYKNLERYREQARHASHIKHMMKAWDKAMIELCLDEKILGEKA